MECDACGAAWERFYAPSLSQVQPWFELQVVEMSDPSRVDPQVIACSMECLETIFKTRGKVLRVELYR